MFDDDQVNMQSRIGDDEWVEDLTSIEGKARQANNCVPWCVVGGNDLIMGFLLLNWWTIHKIYSVLKSFYLNVWPSLLQDSLQATIKAEPVFSDVYMADDVHKYFREAACILAGQQCSLNPFFSSPHMLYTQSYAIWGKQPCTRLLPSPK